MKIVAITDPGHPDMPFFQAVYEDAFPVDEQCPWERMAAFLHVPDHHFRLQGVYLDDGTPVGFNAYSEFGHYLYGIYLAFDPTHRGAGYGHHVLQAFHKQYPDRLLFGEIEYPDTPKARQRLSISWWPSMAAWRVPFCGPSSSLKYIEGTCVILAANETCPMLKLPNVECGANPWTPRRF